MYIWFWKRLKFLGFVSDYLVETKLYIIHESLELMKTSPSRASSLYVLSAPGLKNKQDSRVLVLNKTVKFAFL